MNRLDTNEPRMGFVHKLRTMVSQICTSEAILPYFKTDDCLKITYGLHKLGGSSKEGVL